MKCRGCNYTDEERLKEHYIKKHKYSKKEAEITFNITRDEKSDINYEKDENFITDEESSSESSDEESLDILYHHQH